MLCTNFGLLYQRKELMGRIDVHMHDRLTYAKVQPGLV